MTQNSMRLDDFILIVIVIFCFQECTESKIKKSETVVVKEIRKLNDSINAVEYLNRER